jgi:hypothetical protein
MTPKTIAKIAHESLGAYVSSKLAETPMAWDNLHHTARKAAVSGVMSVMDDPGITVASFHAQWVARMVSAGWRFGDGQDHDGKRHADLQPWEDLPPDRQAKAALVLAVYKALTPFIRGSNGSGKSNTFIFY